MINIYKPCQPVSDWGGVVQNLGPLPSQGPLKKNFPESKNFSQENIGDGGGGVDDMFSENKIGGGEGDDMFSENKIVQNRSRKNIFPIIFKISQPTNPFFFKFCNSTTSGPPPRKLGPPHSPSWHGPGHCRKNVTEGLG